MGATLQEHTAEVDRLSGVTYEGIPEGHLAEMAIEHSLSSLGHLGLQRHLLVVDAPTPEDRCGVPPNSPKYTSKTPLLPPSDGREVMGR